MRSTGLGRSSISSINISCERRIRLRDGTSLGRRSLSIQFHDRSRWASNEANRFGTAPWIISQYERVSHSSRREAGSVWRNRNGHSAQARFKSNQVETRVEEVYERKTPVEHILLRPSMYIGTTESITSVAFSCIKSNTTKRNEIVHGEISYIPGLLKLFDEILVNSADNVERSAETTYVRAHLDAENNIYSIENDGFGMPVVVHEKENMYIPELLMGHLLTGSNFNDNKKRYTGGRHGYGAKLTNIMSNYFEVETLDTDNGKHFKMSWKDHMIPCGVPEVTSYTPESWSLSDKNRKWSSFTKIKYKPDLSIFNLKKMDPGTLQMMRRRVLDIAGVLASRNISVYLDDKLISFSAFEDYARSFLGKANTMVSYTKDAFQICASYSTLEYPVHMSFVNSVATDHGGSHLDRIFDQISSAVFVQVSKRINGKEYNGNMRLLVSRLVRKRLAMFVNVKLANPSFNSQMKDKLTSKLDGSTLNIPAAFVKDVINQTGILEACIHEASRRSVEDLTKSVRQRSSKGQLLSIPKLEDANFAGRPGKAEDCTLIITEGDSAKSLAVAGLSVVGRDKYGVFPLRGKMLNVRDASPKQLKNNAEITNLCAILGLRFGMKYDSEEALRSLRYGHLMLMTDQDFDGSHIKGLILNFFDCFWPDLLRKGEFLKEFVTPLLKARRKNSGEILNFFTLPEFEKWESMESKRLAAEGKTIRQVWKIKYYKGLGTSTAAEAKEYFQALKKHTISFTCDESDNDSCGENSVIDMAFSKIRANDRKAWLLNFFEKPLKERTYVDHDADFLSVPDFINKELVLFSQHDTFRSVPSIFDGLKPSQRKVLYASFKRNLTANEIKVVQLAGYCSEHTAYHHGEVSLQNTIINMAQDFVGSQNLPLLVPSGQFGTRLQGGKDASSPRYIFTQLQPYTRMIFPPEDDSLLEHNEDDGERVEPVNYYPIIPTVLINGAEGIGTGWSTQILTHHPLEVLDNVCRAIRGEPLKRMKPWIRGHKGEIFPINQKNYASGFISSGLVKLSKGKAVIDELPVGVWTEDYKAHLNSLIESNAISSFSEYHTEESVCFHLKLTSRQLSNIAGDPKILKLGKVLKTGNMHLFDSNYRIRRYEDPRDIISEFYPLRLNLYSTRREHVLQNLAQVILKLENQARFTQLICDGTLSLTRRKKEDIFEDLRRLKFDSEEVFNPPEKRASESESELMNTSSDADKIEEERPTALYKHYNYLLRTPLWSLTEERVVELEKSLQEKRKAHEKLRLTMPEQMWLSDLERLRQYFTSVLEIPEVKE